MEKGKRGEMLRTPAEPRVEAGKMQEVRCSFSSMIAASTSSSTAPASGWMKEKKKSGCKGNTSLAWERRVIVIVIKKIFLKNYKFTCDEEKWTTAGRSWRRTPMRRRREVFNNWTMLRVTFFLYPSKGKVTIDEPWGVRMRKDFDPAAFVGGILLTFKSPPWHGNLGCRVFALLLLTLISIALISKRLECRLPLPPCFSLPRFEFSAFVPSEPHLHFVLGHDDKLCLVPEEESQDPEDDVESMDNNEEKVSAEVWASCNEKYTCMNCKLSP